MICDKARCRRITTFNLETIFHALTMVEPFTHSTFGWCYFFTCQYIIHLTTTAGIPHPELPRPCTIKILFYFHHLENHQHVRYFTRPRARAHTHTHSLTHQQRRFTNALTCVNVCACVTYTLKMNYVSVYECYMVLLWIINIWHSKCLRGLFSWVKYCKLNYRQWRT